MPFDFSVDHDRRRVLVTARDPLSVDDVLAVIDRQAAQAWTYGVIHDARATVWVPNSGEVVRVLSYLRNTTRRLGVPRGPVAFVTSGAALFGVARMYSTLGENDRMLKAEVFKDPAAAEQWLNGLMV